MEYLYNYYPLDKADEIANNIRDKVKTLQNQAERGTREPRLKHRKEDYRFLLYKRTKRAEIKIIYYIDESGNRVYVTDFFPTEKDDSEIPKRNM